jgi:hypothetical protein
VELDEIGTAGNPIFPNFFLMMNFYFDPKVTTTRREVYSILSALA